MKKTVAILALSISAGLALAGIAHAQQKTMSIGTGGTGGVYYPLGGAVANVLSKALPNVTATAEVTGGSIDNLKLIGAGQSEMAFTMADALFGVLPGEAPGTMKDVGNGTVNCVPPCAAHRVPPDQSSVFKTTPVEGADGFRTRMDWSLNTPRCVGARIPEAT